MQRIECYIHSYESDVFVYHYISLWYAICQGSVCRVFGMPGMLHDDVIKWNHYPRHWPFVQGIHRWPVNKGHWRGALMLSLIYAWINASVNIREAGDLIRQRVQNDVTVMLNHGEFSKSHTNFTSIFNKSIELCGWGNMVIIYETMMITHRWRYLMLHWSLVKALKHV